MESVMEELAIETKMVLQARALGLVFFQRKYQSLAPQQYTHSF